MSTTIFIYALNDPDNGKCRYIGATSNPKKRFQNHLCSRTSWIKSLVARGLRPVLEVLDEVPKSQWQFWEREYIRVFRAIGFNLVNIAPGGHTLSGEISLAGALNPHFGHKHSDEAKATMRAKKLGKKASTETRAIQSAQRLGRKQKNNTSGFVGVCWFPETKKWQVRISTKPKAINLGYFKKLEDAVFVRALAVNKYLGSGQLNSPSIKTL